jgi:hypothetical protein
VCVSRLFKHKVKVRPLLCIASGASGLHCIRSVRAARSPLHLDTTHMRSLPASAYQRPTCGTRFRPMCGGSPTHLQSSGAHVNFRCLCGGGGGAGEYGMSTPPVDVSGECRGHPVGRGYAHAVADRCHHLSASTAMECTVWLCKAGESACS